MLSVGIIGSSGYTGKYLTKIIANHPKVKSFKLYANNNAGKNLYSVYPEFMNVIEDDIYLSLDKLSNDHDVIFTSLPHGVSMDVVAQIFDKSTLIIDLSGDYRLKNSKLYKKWYGIEHTHPELLNEAKYSLADLEPNIKGTTLISNPGCYPTAVSLGLIPIIKEYNSIITAISTSAYSGVSGAGKKLKEEYLFSELENNLFAYRVNKHQHEPEILQTLSQYGFNADYSFTSHLMPITTGIYSTSVVFTEEGLDQDNLNELYNEFYKKAYFVRTLPVPPKLKDVIMSNFCDLNINVFENKIVITSAIDNLIKGAAGQAVQNMNLYFGFNPNTGLINF